MRSWMLNLLHATREEFQPSMDGKEMIHEWGPCLWILSTSRVQRDQDSRSLCFMSLNSLRPLFQYYLPTPLGYFSHYSWSSSTSRVTRSTSERYHPWMGSSAMDRDDPRAACNRTVHALVSWLQSYVVLPLRGTLDGLGPSLGWIGRNWFFWCLFVISDVIT